MLYKELVYHSAAADCLEVAPNPSLAVVDKYIKANHDKQFDLLHYNSQHFVSDLF